MEVLVVILLLVVIYLVYTAKNEFTNKMNELDFRIIMLQELLKKSDQQKTTIQQVEPPVVEKQPVKPVEEQQAVDIVPEPIIPPVVVQQEETLKELEPIAAPAEKILPPSPTLIENPRLSFFERYPDLEKAIGENWVNKIGIAILVLSIGYFVKYAIDSNWIGPMGRVAIGMICGGILIGFAHKMRNTYKAFSSVLVGGGLAVFYFTITLAYHQFHLFNQGVSFAILIVITTFAVVLSLLYNRQELAIIALVGGFVSPFMVSSGQANYHGLFAYLLILNTGLLIIAYYKAWRILNISAFALTVIVFSGVLYRLTTPTYYIGLIYATVFYFLFFVVNIAYNVRENKRFIASDFGILLANTAIYFAAGLYLLTVMGYEDFRGLFSAGLGVINLTLSYVLFRNRKVDTNILYLLIGITLTFISLTAPIQLHGNYITLFWASEAVLLYWLYLKSGIKLIRFSSLIIWAAMLCSLIMDWQYIYSYSDLTLTVIANKGFITTVYAAVSSYLMSRLIKKDAANEDYSFKIPENVFKVIALMLLFLAGLLEINHQFLNHYPDTSLNLLYLMLYIPAFVFFFTLVVSRVGVAFNWKIRAAILVVSIVVFLIYTSVFFDIQYDMLVNNTPATMHFTVHWVGALFIGSLFYQLIRLCHANLEESFRPVAIWILPLSIILFLSLEVNLISNMLFYSKANSIDYIQSVYIKTGLPILWGLCSFALMWLGMRNKVRGLRIVSLSLFTVTLLKLFLFDIRNISAAGKIAAFFCLGVLLLIISFMYQRVRHIIIADEDINKA